MGSTQIIILFQLKHYIYEVEAMFREQGTLEAVLITKDGNPDGNLLGIIRPRDIYKQIEKDDFLLIIYWIFSALLVGVDQLVKMVDH